MLFSSKTLLIDFDFRFAVLDRDLLTIKPHDTWADFDNRFYERVVAFKKKGVKVTVAIGGWVKNLFKSCLYFKTEN